MKLSLQTKKKRLSNHLYGSKYSTFSSGIKEEVEATETCFYRRRHRILWTEHERNKEVSKVI